MVWFTGALFLSCNPVTCKYLILFKSIWKQVKTYTECKGKMFYCEHGMYKMHFRICCYISNEEKRPLTWDKWTVLQRNEEHAHSCSNSTILIPITGYYIAFMTMFIKIANIGPTPALLSIIQIFSESCRCVEGTMRANWHPTSGSRRQRWRKHQKQKTKPLFYKSKKANIIPRNIIICKRNLNCSILTPLKPRRVCHWDQWSLKLHTEI